MLKHDAQHRFNIKYLNRTTGLFIFFIRNIPILKSQGSTVVLDITHSLQQPNQQDGTSGGQPQFAETLAKCGIITGVDGIFLETHPNPEKALSDGKNMIKLDKVEPLIQKLIQIKT